MSSTQRVVVITGASSGIGTVTAEHFAGLGDRVIVVGRNPERTQAVADRLGAEALLADYDRLDDVRALAAAIRSRTDHVDVLLNNAGGLVSTRTRTVDGFDSTFQTNHLAPYLLTRLLLPELVAGSATGPDSPEAGRVVSTSSVANRFGRLDLDDLDGFDRPWRGGWRAYGTAKLAVVLFTRELARRQQAADTG
ncbi:MAG: SDR family NAD(P)-dependent oxidoreductase, partial [Herbiconiux sp.]|nr:SDR family NAD(P)-dependent oxidoreductase [Herbiconiux sp.]